MWTLVHVMRNTNGDCFAITENYVPYFEFISQTVCFDDDNNIEKKQIATPDIKAKGANISLRLRV